MKKLLLILALCLVPLNVADACPGRKGPCNGQCTAPLVTIPIMVREVLDTTATVVDRVRQSAQQGREVARKLMTQVAFDKKVSDQDVQRVAGIFDKGLLLMRLAFDDLREASKLAATATIEAGPVAVSLRLRAAASFTDATVKLNRARLFFLEVEKSAAALLGVEVKNPC